MARKTLLASVLCAIGAASLAAFFAYRAGAAAAAHGGILGVQHVGGGVTLNVIEYKDGTFQIIVNDTDKKSEIGVLHLAASLDASGHPYVPNFTSQGDVWQRGAFTYDDAGHPGCQRHIIFVSRTESRISQASTPYCINWTVDQHDITLFFGWSEDDKMEAIGEYDGGKIRSAIPAIEPFGYQMIPAWDNSRIFLFQEAMGDIKPAGKIWNVKTGTVKDVVLPKPSAKISGFYVSYDNEKGAFVAHANVLPTGKEMDYVLGE